MAEVDVDMRVRGQIPEDLKGGSCTSWWGGSRVWESDWKHLSKAGGMAKPFFSLPLLIRNPEVSWLESGQTDPLALPTLHVPVSREAHSLCAGNCPAVRGKTSILWTCSYINRLGKLAWGTRTPLRDLQTGFDRLVSLWVSHLSLPPSHEKEYGVFFLAEVLSEGKEQKGRCSSY